MKITVEESYQKLRSMAYPSLPDQLDAIFKMAKQLKESGIELPADTVEWMQNCQKVKDTFPKP